MSDVVSIGAIVPATLFMLTTRHQSPKSGRRGATSEPKGWPGRVRSVAVSVALHVVIVAGLWQVLQFQRVIGAIFSSRDESAVAERIRFVAVSPQGPAGVSLGSSASAPPARTVAPAPTSTPEVSTPTPPPAAPVVVPEGVAPASKINTSGPETGPIASGRGELRGVQPGFTEPRIWVEGDVVVAPPLTGDDKLDSAVAAIIFAYRDSVAANTAQPNKYERGDWTYTTPGGAKFGIDKQFIRLGKVSIPTALLGLLPLNYQTNPTVIERDRRLSAMRLEIIENAQRAMNEEEFKAAVKAIRARKDKERKEAEKKKAVPKVISEGREH